LKRPLVLPVAVVEVVAVQQHTGTEAVASRNNLLTTVAWLREGRMDYALEGSVFIAGAAIQWLRDGLGLLKTAADSEKLAKSVDSTLGVYLVPALVGLGAPYWDAAARGAIVGLTRGVERPHLVRAALESLAYQTRDVVDAMAADSGHPLTTLRVDGGAAANDFLMQLQADLLGVPVERPQVVETTALGAAHLAGIALGWWDRGGAIPGTDGVITTFRPAVSRRERERLRDGWREAVSLLLRPPARPVARRARPAASRASRSRKR
jgi:glycerol kinase